MPQGIATWVSGWREIRFDGNALVLGMATAMLAMIPPALVVILMQKWFVKGLVDTEK